MTTPIPLGSKLELFVDDALIDRMSNAELRLHQPAAQDVSMLFDEPWEGNSSGHVTVFEDEGLVRMYYRGKLYAHDLAVRDKAPQIICYAESTDGIDWKKPSLGLVEFAGSKDNNIVWNGPGSNNFSPFLDTNPDCEPDAKYKSIGTSRKEGGGQTGIYVFKSPDGISWSLMNPDPVITKGMFDSHNVAFWDGEAGFYREYHRDSRNDADTAMKNAATLLEDAGSRGRDIRQGTSNDFINWTDPEYLRYSPGRVSELYTNNILPYYRAPHILLGFPSRYLDRGWTESTTHLPQLDHRKLRAETAKSPRAGTAVSDGMFMSSRNGRDFNMWPESFIRPGLRVKDGWFYGDNYQNTGLVETDSKIEGAGRELSIYLTEGYHQVDSIERLRRYTIRIDGFVSVQARLDGGELLTKPITFEGSELVLNFSTSVPGSIQVEVQDEVGHAIEGFTMDDCHEIWGDDLARTVKWGETTDVSALAGRPVRLRFLLKDADLYSMQFK